MKKVDLRTAGSILSVSTVELRKAIEASGTRTTIRVGESLFNEGEAGDAFYVIESGEIEISVHSLDGRKLSLEILREGEAFGEIALFGGKRTASATALTDCTLSSFRRADVMARLRCDPKLAMDFIDALCERLRYMSQRLEEQTFLPLPVRLASRLLYLDNKIGGTGQIRVSQSELADFVGATREGVAKTLAVWRAREWIKVGRGSIRILEPAELGKIEQQSEK